MRVPLALRFHLTNDFSESLTAIKTSIEYGAEAGAPYRGQSL